MKQTCLAIMIVLIAGLAFVPASYAQHQHEGDFHIGVNAVGKLVFEFDEHMLAGEECVVLPASVNPAIPGWVADAPGFEAVEADEPAEDIYTLADGASIRLVGVDLDAGLFVRAPSIGTPVAIAPTPTLGYLSLGDEHLHTHAVWHLDPTAPGYQPQASWSGTFKFVDVGTTGYADSDAFTLCFVPEPGSLMLLVLGGLTTLARRRR